MVIIDQRIKTRYDQCVLIITYCFITNSLCLQKLPTSKPLLGVQLAPDDQAMFRLPNQSSECADFINTFYLDGSTLPSGVINRPDWDFTKWTAPEYDPIQPGHVAGIETMQGFGAPEKFGSSNKKKDDPILYTFISPNYPKKYPARLDCIKVIRAPEVNQRIVLDFRGPFQLEPSPGCSNDYLEIRDGQFGFSPLIGRFCKDILQLRPIVSGGRWLWLRLHSDYSLETLGFQAVFYIVNMNYKTPSRNPTRPDPVEAIINVDTGGVIDTRNLSHYLTTRRYSSTSSYQRADDRQIDIILDFRTTKPDMILLIHLHSVKFPFTDPGCELNVIEIYEDFFLTDKTSETIASHKKMWKNSLFRPKLSRACNQPHLPLVVCQRGRGVMRVRSTFLNKEYPKSEQKPTDLLNSNITFHIPQMIVAFSALTMAPCRPDWLPCMRLDDLLAHDERLNASGNSVVDLLTKSAENIDHEKVDTVLPDGSEIKYIYCYPVHLMCDNQTNCPNVEDEDQCPRYRGDLRKIINSYPKLAGNYDETGSIANGNGNKDDSTHQDDEFTHHTYIIVGLLGFCAICGLISVGMTTVSDTKQTNKPWRWSAVCEKLFLSTNDSAIRKWAGVNVNKDSGPTQMVGDRTGNPIVSISRIDTQLSMLACEPTDQQVPVKECLEKTTGCASLCNSSQDRHHLDELKDIPLTNKLNTPVEKHNDETGCEKVPTQWISPEDAERQVIQNMTSPIWHRTYRDNTWTSGQVKTTSNKNVTDPIGNLPNTVVFPVGRLSNLVYQCGQTGNQSGGGSHLTGSGPLSLIRERVCNPSRYGIHSAHNHSQASSIGSPDVLDFMFSPERNGKHFDFKPTNVNIGSMRPNATGHFLAAGSSRRNMSRFRTRNSVGECEGTDRHIQPKREKEIRGGAPKRPRYSDKLERENDYGINGNQIHSNALELLKTELLTSSCSTSGEILEEFSSTLPNHRQRNAHVRPNWVGPMHRSDIQMGYQWKPRDVEELSSESTCSDSRHQCHSATSSFTVRVRSRPSPVNHQPQDTQIRLACDCALSGQKNAYLSSLSMTDQQCLEHDAFHPPYRPRSAGDLQFGVSHYSSNPPTTGEESEETPGCCDDIYQPDRIGKRLNPSHQISPSSETTTTDSLAINGLNDRSKSTIVITKRDGQRLVYCEEQL